MTHAYSESYLSNAKDRLSQYFDYTINDCKINANWAAKIFWATGYAEQFERGNPAILAGMSGVELAHKVILRAYRKKELPEPTFTQEKSPEYWAGWALAEYQWYTGRRFKDIFERISFSEIISMYHPYHEMDITNFINAMEQRYNEIPLDTKLKRIRESRGISQSEVSKLSGVKLRSIQMYEQRANDIDKAQAKTLYKIARVLGCDIEDLLENPME